MVSVWVYAPGMQTYGEQRVDVGLAYDALQARLERVTGIPPAEQVLTLFSASDVQHGQQTGSARVLPTPPCAPDAAPLALWRVADGMMIRVDDRRGAMLDGDVEKYEMSDADYAKRTDSVRAFKEAHGLGRFGEKAPEPVSDDLVVGARCSVARDESFGRRGTIAYVGSASFAPGPWVGVVYDEPVGKNDGSVQGVRYFTCAPQCGGMVRPAMVTVGDFPPEIDWSDEEL